MDALTRESPGFPAPVQGVQLGQLVRLLRGHAWLIGLCAVLGAAAAFTYARTVPKSYTASSLVAVEGDRFAIPELQGVLRSDGVPDPMPGVRTELQVIASRDLLLPVIAKLHLADLPEYNAALRPPGMMQAVKDAIQQVLPSQPAAKGAAGNEEVLLGAVSRGLSVFHDGRSLVIEVSFTSQDPQISSDVVNALIGQYVASRAKRRVTANQGANAALTGRIDQARLDLADIERQMSDMRSKGELVGLRAGSIGQQQVEDLTSALTRTSVERAQLQTAYERASALAKQGSSEALASVLGSATISHLRDQEGAASRRVAELSVRYGTGHPAVQSAQADLSSATRQLREETGRIVASLGTQLRVTREHEADLQKQLDGARGTGVKAENARAQLEQLQHEETSRRAMYQTLLERAQQTVVQPSGTETPDVRVVSQAAPPANPSSPNMKFATGAGSAGGALLGCLLALARLRTVLGFRTPLEFTAATGLAVTAPLPRDLVRRGGKALVRRVASQPAGPEAEALRSLRAEVPHLARARVPRCVMFTGAGPDQSAGGSAALAVAIGVAMARVAALDGERVLLIEGHVQAPSVARLLGLQSGSMSPVLEGREIWRNQVVHDPATPLHVLAGKQPAEHSTALLTTTGFQNLLVAAQADYDLLVLTAPPVTAAATLALAQRADAVLLVADAKTTSEQAQTAAARLTERSRNALGIVLVGP